MLRFARRFRLRLSVGAIAALAAVAAITLWAASHRFDFRAVLGTGSNVAELYLRQGDLTCTYATGRTGRTDRPSMIQVIDPKDVPSMTGYPPLPLRHRWWRIEWEQRFSEASLFLRPWHVRSLRFPFGFVLVWPLTVCVWAIAKPLRTFLRQGKGKCAVCGYDLRATPDRCPECGTISPS